ncbi:putative endonuclease or glycosyl hydrolase [Actinidia rufa]|uniref:Putative endonuclease or glycosyl hydrolase n=1 Tax=Actinidia rufa TaxID=165716 RepID=A0A7J0DRG7_9ERIC|nr:putative endonuclease or glycosyl hydrolase [Actinidia rufa]
MSDLTEEWGTGRMATVMEAWGRGDGDGGGIGVVEQLRQRSLPAWWEGGVDFRSGSFNAKTIIVSVTVFDLSIRLISSLEAANDKNWRCQVGLPKNWRKTRRCTKWEKDAADKFILIDVFFFALDNLTPSSIMLISGDVDFAPALYILGHHDYACDSCHSFWGGCFHLSSAMSNAGGFVWDWPSVAHGEGFVPLSKDLIPPHGVLAEIVGYMMGCHINDNPNGQNEPAVVIYRGISQGVDNSSVFSMLSQLSEYNSTSITMPLFPLNFKISKSSICISAFVADDHRAYIIHMDKSTMPAPFSDHHNWYMSTLSSLSSPDGVLPTHHYTYTHVLDGFSEVLSRSQLDELEKMPGHITTYPDTMGTVHTAHTPSKETCDDNSLDHKEVAGKQVFCDYIDENSDVNTFKIDRAGAAGAIFSMDFGPFLEPVDFYIPFVAVTPKYDLIKDYLIKTKNSTVDIRVLTNVVNTRTVYHAVVKAPLGMKVVVEPPTIAFTGKYSKARFDVTVEVDIGDAGPTSDYIVSYGYLIWNEVNGMHVVRSPIVAACAP